MNNKIDITKPVQTRDGRKVLGLTRIDAKGIVFPIVGLIEGEDSPKNWKNDGSFYRDEYNSHNDIVNVKEKKIVPLTHKDIKPTDIFRPKEWEKGFQTISWMNGYCICLNESCYDKGFPKLREEYLISRDGGTTWQNCEKEIEE